MPVRNSAVTLLVADDDEEDRALIREAIEEAELDGIDVSFVTDGAQLLDYLNGQGTYADLAGAPRPALILLDLYMPRVNGREALLMLKGEPDLRDIPIVVLTTSTAKEDIRWAYAYGANSYVTKPLTREGRVEIVRILHSFWIETAERPDDC